MIKILVDTSVWRHWFALKDKKTFPSPDIEEDAKAFSKIYDMVSSLPQKFLFIYNARVEDELYKYKYQICFQKIKSSNYIKKVSIPLSRVDGSYKCNGSMLAGGDFGGSLRDILSMYGYDHDAAFRNAKLNINRKNSAHTNPRKKEFDIEHLESALEAKSDLFLTSDYKLIRRLNEAARYYPENKEIIFAKKICLRPVDALLKLCIGIT